MAELVFAVKAAFAAAIILGRLDDEAGRLLQIGRMGGPGGASGYHGLCRDGDSDYGRVRGRGRLKDAVDMV